MSAQQPASQQIIGVASYTIGADGRLIGVWTVQSMEGETGCEVATPDPAASGGSPGLGGRYDVVIIKPPRPGPIFSGTLTIAPLGDVLKMTWDGRDATGTHNRYEGMGLQNGDILSATYWGQAPRSTT